MAFFNLRTVRTHNAGRGRKRDYHRPGYQNPMRGANERSTLVPRIAMRATAFVSVLALFIAMLYWTLFSGAVGVDLIEVEGTQRTPADEVRRITQETLNRRRFLILNQRKSLFVVDTVRLEARLKEYFALSSVRALPRLPRTLNITVQERIPAYTVADARGEGVIIDHSGIIIAPFTREASSDSEVLLALTVPALTTTTTGEALFDQSAMLFLRDVKEALPSITQGYEISELDLARVLVHDIIAKTSEPWVIYMTDQEAPRLQFLNVDRALQEMKDERKKIQYIDVRLPNKIFYK